MTKPYPDLRHYSLRDYGNRVGIYRFFKAFDQYNITPTFAMNTRLAERLPYLVGTVKERGDEIICHGYDMDKLHYGGQDITEEKDLVIRSLDGLRKLAGHNFQSPKALPGSWIVPSVAKGDVN